MFGKLQQVPQINRMDQIAPMVFPGSIVMPWTTTDVFNVIDRTHLEYSPTLTAFTEVSRGLSQLIILTDYDMSCFEMVEKRPVTSGRLNLGGREREVVSSKQGKNWSPDPWLPSIALVDMFSGSISWQVVLKLYISGWQAVGYVVG